MQITRYDKHPYGFTLRRTKDPDEATEELYRAHLHRIFPPLGCTLGDYVFETESGLHCHGIVDIPNKCDFRRLNLRGWHIHLDELIDPQCWVIYMNKHQPSVTTDLQDDPSEERETSEFMCRLNRKLF